MIFDVKVVPRASKNLIREENGHLKVYVTAPAKKGRANEAVVELLARHFDVAKSAVRILRGASSRRKAVEVERR